MTKTATAATGYDAYVQRLRAGETISFRSSGHSMEPRIRHRQLCTYAPVLSAQDVQVQDAVFCRVAGRYMTHLISAQRDGRYQISNLRGRPNGWIGLEQIYGKVVQVQDEEGR